MEARVLLIQFAQIVFSTFVMFFFMVLVAEAVLFVFRIKNARTRAFIRAIPILKLPFELFYVRDSVFIDVNLFSCSSILKQWIVPLFISKENWMNSNLTLCQYIAFQIPEFLTLICVILLFLFLGIAIYRSGRFLHTFYQLQKICGLAEIYEREITNPKLKHMILEKNIQILVSSDVVVPCAVNLNSIIFPKTIVQDLSQEEFESIVSHELEHLFWFDPLIKCATIFISSIFFWIPTSFWLNNLESEQENASDLSIHRYGLCEVSFANAIFKIMKNIQLKQQGKRLLLPASNLVKSPYLSVRRFQAILKGERYEIPGTFQYCGVLILILTAISIGFKMC